MTDDPPPVVNPLTGRLVRTEEEREEVERFMAERTAGREASDTPPPPVKDDPPEPPVSPPS